jgi:flagellar basal body rod protein FlgG
MKKIYCLVLAFLLGSVFCFSQEKEISILFVDQNQQMFYKKYFYLNNIYFEEDGIYLKVSENIELLKNILQIEKLKIDVIRNNIANVHTTRTNTGGPFNRCYVDIENEIIVKEDTEENIRYVYDPTHPDAQNDGSLAGYVKYPNIYITNEYYELNCAIQLFNNIAEYIQRNNIEIIVDKFQMDKPGEFSKEYFILLLNLINAHTTGYKYRYIRYEYSDIDNGRNEMMEINFSQGALKSTSRELDFAIIGDGFFKLIFENNRIGYTRNGEFTIDENTNELITIDGCLLYDKIVIQPGFKKIIITRDHSIKALYSDGEEIHCGYLNTYKLDNNKLEYYDNKNIFVHNGNEEEIVSDRIINSFLESSNVDQIKTIVEILEISKLLNMQLNIGDNEWFTEFILNNFLGK